jgi:hypothetical protein
MPSLLSRPPKRLAEKPNSTGNSYALPRVGSRSNVPHLFGCLDLAPNKQKHSGTCRLSLCSGSFVVLLALCTFRGTSLPFVGSHAQNTDLTIQ